MILAIFLHTIEFNFITITSILLTNIIGIYLSVIGFAIGLSFDAPTIDAAGTPILFIIATFIIPWKHLLPANSLLISLLMFKSYFQLIIFTTTLTIYRLVILDYYL